MYHDQVLTPIKALYGFNAINTISEEFNFEGEDGTANTNIVHHGLNIALEIPRIPWCRVNIFDIRFTRMSSPRREEFIQFFSKNCGEFFFVYKKKEAEPPVRACVARPRI